ncbi:MAG: hypothetical protein R6T91_02085 [Bacteroidales bacterium]
MMLRLLIILSFLSLFACQSNSSKLEDLTVNLAEQIHHPGKIGQFKLATGELHRLLDDLHQISMGWDDIGVVYPFHQFELSDIQIMDTTAYAIVNEENPVEFIQIHDQWLIHNFDWLEMQLTGLAFILATSSKQFSFAVNLASSSLKESVFLVQHYEKMCCDKSQQHILKAPVSILSASIQKMSGSILYQLEDKKYKLSLIKENKCWKVEAWPLLQAGLVMDQSASDPG